MKPDSDTRVTFRSQLFTVRVWREELADEQHEWRGKVQHVNSGEAFYFRRWSELGVRLEAWLEQEDSTGPAID